MNFEKKRRNEKEIVQLMVRIYCQKKHHQKYGLCLECQNLLDYSQDRIDHCPNMETKTFCSACPTHCYRPDMREKIRLVMRFSGPRMIFHRPVTALRHAIVMAAAKRETP